MTSRTRILMFAPIMPSDSGNGLAMRAGFFLDAYARQFDVDLVVVPVAGSPVSSEFVRRRTRRVEVLRIAGANSHYTLVNSIRDTQERLDAFRRYGRPSLTAFVSPVLPILRSVISNTRYDLVHIFRLYLAELAAPWTEKNGCSTRLVIDCDENDALTYGRMAEIERRRQNLIGATFAGMEAAAFIHFAAQWLPKFDVVVAASPREAKSLGSFGARTLSIPNVVPELKRNPHRPTRIPTIVFVGTLAYMPNLDGLTWFVGRVFRRLRQALAYQVRLIIVGRNPPAAIARLRSQRGIEVWDKVADISRCYRIADLAIAPLRAGGGMRIKIVEAAAYGIPVVTTPLGAEGTTFQNGVHMLMANGEANFLRACLSLLRDQSLSRRLAKQARAKAMRDYSQGYWQTQVAYLAPERHEGPSEGGGS